MRYMIALSRPLARAWLVALAVLLAPLLVWDAVAAEPSITVEPEFGPPNGWVCAQVRGWPANGSEVTVNFVVTGPRGERIVGEFVRLADDGAGNLALAIRVPAIPQDWLVSPGDLRAELSFYAETRPLPPDIYEKPLYIAAFRITDPPPRDTPPYCGSHPVPPYTPPPIPRVPSEER